MQPKAPFYSGGVFNKLKTRRDTSTYTFISMGGQKVEVQKLKSALALCRLLFSALVSISDGYISYDFLPNLLQRELLERSRSQLSGASCCTQFREAVWEIWGKRCSICKLGQFQLLLEKGSHWLIYWMPNLELFLCPWIWNIKGSKK